MSDQKSILRKKMLKQRDALALADIESMSGRITKKILEHPKFISAKIVFLYSSFGSEVSTKNLILEAQKADKEVYLPIIASSPFRLVFRHFTSFEEMKKGRFGIWEPTEEILPSNLISSPEPCFRSSRAAAQAADALTNAARSGSKDPDLIIVPGVCFDLHCHRLGYGKGYYDQFLKLCKSYRIGICFDFQLVDKIPNDEFDQKMDEVITEKS